MKKFTMLAVLAVLASGSVFASPPAPHVYDPIALIKQKNKGDSSAIADHNALIGKNVYLQNGAAGNTVTMKKGILLASQDNNGDTTARASNNLLLGKNVGLTNYAAGNAITMGCDSCN